MILDMDADSLPFPKQFLREAGKPNRMGCRYPKKMGRQGNGLGFHLPGHGRSGDVQTDAAEAYAMDKTIFE